MSHSSALSESYHLPLCQVQTASVSGKVITEPAHPSNRALSIWGKEKQLLVFASGLSLVCPWWQGSHSGALRKLCLPLVCSSRCLLLENHLTRACFPSVCFWSQCFFISNVSMWYPVASRSHHSHVDGNRKCLLLILSMWRRNCSLDPQMKSDELWPSWHVFYPANCAGTTMMVYTLNSQFPHSPDIPAIIQYNSPCLCILK